jgi:hypothetical protein
MRVGGQLHSKSMELRNDTLLPKEDLFGDIFLKIALHQVIN